MANLQIKNLTKYFDDAKVLNDINLNVTDGEFIVLVGPSGSGKSTILRVIAGLEEPTSGEVVIDNKVVNKVHPKDRDVAMVFQNYSLYPHLSIFDNIAFSLKMKKVHSTEITKRVNEVASLLGVQNYLSKRPKELSGGERQRVALGRAIVRNPNLFLMDEPLSNLDAKLRVQMRSEILKLYKSLSATIVYVTHDQIEALTMGSKIVVLNNGCIQQVDTPINIYNNPANLFVATFIGSPAMNLLDIKFADNNKFILCGNVYDISFLNLNAKNISISDLLGKELVLGVRPEHLRLEPCGEIKLTASIDLIEMLGDQYLVYASIKNDSQKNNAYTLSIKLNGNCHYKQNDLITASVDATKIFIFDKISGKLIKPCQPN